MAANKNKQTDIKDRGNTKRLKTSRFPVLTAVLLKIEVFWDVTA
jgi:hypothetical protein